MKNSQHKKIIITLAKTLSIEETCRIEKISKDEIRDILLEIAGYGKKSEARPQKTAVMYVDGASRGNPGPAGAGVVITENGKMTEGIAQFLGEKTNNQAEYQALIIGLKRISELGIRNIEVRSDSELMVKQLNKQYKVKNPALIPLNQQAQKLIEKLDSFKIKHVPRDRNREADALANRAIDEFN